MTWRTGRTRVAPLPPAGCVARVPRPSAPAVDRGRHAANRTDPASPASASLAFPQRPRQVRARYQPRPPEPPRADRAGEHAVTDRPEQLLVADVQRSRRLPDREPRPSVTDDVSGLRRRKHLGVDAAGVELVPHLPLELSPERQDGAAILLRPGGGVGAVHPQHPPDGFVGEPRSELVVGQPL
jgi:hypothetical protein